MKAGWEFKLSLLFTRFIRHLCGGLDGRTKWFLKHLSSRSVIPGFVSLNGLKGDGFGSDGDEEQDRMTIMHINIVACDLRY